MRLFFDIDGVLLNFESTFTAFLNKTYGSGLPADYQTETWLFEEVLGPGGFPRAWAGFLASPEVGRMPPLIEPERFNALARGRPVHLVTHFPVEFRHKRETNLGELGFGFDSLHYCGLASGVAGAPLSKAETIRGLLPPGERALFCDDHPENCVAVRELCPEVEVWLMSRRFNQDFHHPQVNRAEGWGCLIERLEER